MDDADLRSLVARWFEAWETGDYRAIPVTDDFTHTSPFGTVDGKAAYLSLVESNEDQFLGFTFDVHDEVHADGAACVRYTARKGDFSLEASEWFFGTVAGIDRIVSYYNLGGPASYAGQ
jgi:limonene-1,2-epoxide hydrolase